MKLRVEVSMPAHLEAPHPLAYPPQKVGAERGLESLMLAFYARVLEDPELAPFFQDSSLVKLHAMQRELFAMALGGNIQYTGTPLAHAHHGRGISAYHFARFTSHLPETLREQKLDEEDVNAVIDRINSFANEITGASH
jgi:hemoglobin